MKFTKLLLTIAFQLTFISLVFSNEINEEILDDQLEVSDLMKAFDVTTIDFDELNLDHYLYKDATAQPLKEVFLGPASTPKLFYFDFSNVSEEEYFLNIDFGMIRKLNVKIIQDTTEVEYHLGTNQIHSFIDYFEPYVGYIIPLPKGKAKVVIGIDGDDNTVMTNFFITKKEFLSKQSNEIKYNNNILKSITTFQALMCFLMFIVLRKNIILFCFMNIVGLTLFTETQSLIFYNYIPNETLLYVFRLIGNNTYTLFTLLLYMSIYPPLKYKKQIIIVSLVLTSINAVLLTFYTFVGLDVKVFSLILTIYNISVGQLFIFTAMTLCLLNMLKTPNFWNIGIFTIQSFLYGIIGIFISSPSLGLSSRMSNESTASYYINLIQILFFIILIIYKFIKDEQIRKSIQLSIYEIRDKTNTALIEGEMKEREKIGNKLTKNISENLKVLTNTNNNDLDTKTLEKTIFAVRSLSHQLLLPNFEEDEFEDIMLDLLMKHNTEKISCFMHLKEWENVQVTVQQHIYRLIQEILIYLEERECSGSLFFNFTQEELLGDFSIEWSSTNENTEQIFAFLSKAIRYRIIAIDGQFSEDIKSQNYFLNLTGIDLSGQQEKDALI
ncbi:hypothetical protein [Flammeovirga pacifica]|uniref:7TM-DISM receptor extracellular domain-containing protein n=1 Tax=Flammeovirga pacifica TaxID=915059 RepID=A0A1S1YTM4_FLAPC|nr:hypothetical protein [Flammeovirga pacifica]OHX64377.1 hypothetical protein NH26_22555 [Flammeovirga pacifica]